MVCIPYKVIIERHKIPVILQLYWGFFDKCVRSSFLKLLFYLFFFFFLISLFIYFWFIYLFICLFLAVLGPVSARGLFSSCGEQGPLFITVRGPLTVTASRCEAQAPDAQAQ